MHLFANGHDSVLRWYREHQAQKLASEVSRGTASSKEEPLMLGIDKKFRWGGCLACGRLS